MNLGARIGQLFANYFGAYPILMWLGVAALLAVCTSATICLIVGVRAAPYWPHRNGCTGCRIHPGEYPWCWTDRQVADDQAASAHEAARRPPDPPTPQFDRKGAMNTEVAATPNRNALARASNWYAVATGAVEVAKAARSKWREWHNYTVSITSEDSRYQDVHDWLLSAVPAVKLRALAVRSDEQVGHLTLSSDDDTSGPSSQVDRLFTTYDSAQEQTIDVDGHSVRVTVEHVTPDGNSRRAAPDKIMFRCTSQEAQQAVVARLRVLIGARKKRTRPPQLWMLSSWGTWQRRSDLPRRTPESVVLRTGQMEALTGDLGAFLDREADYVRRGIPWHRGYLLQGPPGTGKTSVAKALATRFELDLWYAPLGDLSKDANLLSLLSEVRPRSMLLLEDVDIYHAATTREAETGRVTLSGLLNALDGVATPHGLITVLTSNEPKVLDQALVRPGRVDRIEDVDYVTQEQARRLFNYFYGQPPTGRWRVDEQTSTADLTEVFKRNMDDPDAAERALRSH